MTETSRIIGPLLQFFFPDMPYEMRQVIHGYVRKIAHFTEYAVLASLTFRALSMSASGFLQKWRYILAILFVAVIASVDEFNQSFEALRTGAFSDVLLDISGGVGAVLAVFCIQKARDRCRPDARVKV